MSLRDIIVLVLIACILVGVSVMSIINSSQLHERAHQFNAPPLTALYKATTPDQKAVVDNVVTCMVQYGKIDPGHTPAHEFDPTPLSNLSPERRTEAAHQLKVRLEGMCVAYGFRAIQAGRHVADLTPERFAQSAAALGMDMQGAQSWLDKGSAR